MQVDPSEGGAVHRHAQPPELRELSELSIRACVCIRAQAKGGGKFVYTGGLRTSGAPWKAEHRKTTIKHIQDLWEKHVHAAQAPAQVRDYRIRQLWDRHTQHEML